MKAVVLENQNGLCAVLKEDGSFAKIRMAAAVGEEVDLPMIASISYMPLRRIAAVACIALLTLFSALTALVQEYTYVSMDVGPSIEYALNRIDRVINVEAMNPDGEYLLDEMKDERLNGKTIDIAVSATTEALYRTGFLNSNIKDETVLLSVSSKSRQKSDSISKVMEENFVDDEVNVDMEKVSLKDRKEAKSYGLSTGRYVKAKVIAGSEKLDAATVDMARTSSVDVLVKTASTALNRDKHKGSAQQKLDMTQKKDSKSMDSGRSSQKSSTRTDSSQTTTSATQTDSSTTRTTTGNGDTGSTVASDTATPADSSNDSTGQSSSGSSSGNSSSSSGSSSGSSSSSSQADSSSDGSSSSSSDEVVVDPVTDADDEGEVDKEESEPKKFQDDGTESSSDDTADSSSDDSF